VYLPDEGIYLPIRELEGRTGFRVLAVDTQSWRLEPRTVTHAFSTGRKPVFKLRTRLGREIRATANHKFLAFDGWRRLDDLAPGMRLAVPRRLVGPQAETMTDSELALLGHLIGEHERERAVRLAAGVASPELANLATSDVYWDEILTIDPDGRDDVYDLTVDGLHNFVAEDMSVHNSIEQDADLVAFIYRDEYYNDESDQQGLAEVILAKHRNGPTDAMKLSFLKRYAKFADLAAA
jgi:replicative DNA helicase